MEPIRTRWYSSNERETDDAIDTGDELFTLTLEIDELGTVASRKQTTSHRHIGAIARYIYPFIERVQHAPMPIR